MLVGMATVLLMLGIILGLIRQVRALSATVSRFRDDVAPVLERLRAESDTARSRAEAIPEQVPTRKPGARIRR